jgi:hypothetical protein
MLNKIVAITTIASIKNLYISKTFDELLNKIKEIKPFDPFFIGIPDVIMNLIMKFINQTDINGELAYHAIELGWFIGHDNVDGMEETFILKKIFFEQLISRMDLNDDETALVNHLSNKIGKSRFAKITGTQDVTTGDPVIAKNKAFQKALIRVMSIFKK